MNHIEKAGHKQQVENIDNCCFSGINRKISPSRHIYVLIFLAFPFLIFPEARGNSRWRISAESGFYQRRLVENGNSIYFLSRFNGYLKFQNRSQSNFWWLSLQLKPEFYQDVLNYSTIKMVTKGQYLHQKSNLRLGMGLDIRRYFYINTPENLSLDLFELSGILSYSIKHYYQIVCYPAYYYQDISDYPKQKLDALKIKIYLSRAYSNRLNMGAGIYFENFSVRNHEYYPSQLNHNDNNGYRLGPEVFLQSHRFFYLTIRYSFLWHYSEITLDPSSEKYIRVLVGKVFMKNLTVLCLIDYYWNNLKLKNNNEFPALYIPFDTENRIDLKIERPVTKNLIYFIRGGYFKDNFVIQNFTAQGWQFLLGFEYIH